MHDGHPGHTGEDQPFQVAPFLVPEESFPMRGVEGLSPIAYATDGLENLAESDTGWVPAHADSASGIVHAHVEQALQPSQPSLGKPQAGGAANVFQEEIRLAPTRAFA
jgi:hypothetical protein